MKRLVSALLILAATSLSACSTTTAQKVPPQVEPAADPSQRPERVGWFPLPEQLEKDPRKVAIPPLEFEIVKPQKRVLSNGLTVYFMEDHTTPLINLRALVWAGSVDVPAEKLGLADLTFDLMTSGGAGKLSAEELEQLLESLAADIGGGAGEETSAINLNLRTEDLDTLFPVFVSVLREPRFQKNRFEIAVARYGEAFARREDSPDGLASRALQKAIFGPTSVFGREPTVKTLANVGPADLKAFHAKMLIPKNTMLLVTGDFQTEAMLARIEKELGAWKGGERNQRKYEPAGPLKRRVIFVPKDIAQAKIRIGNYGFERLAPVEFSARVMNTALGGGLGAGRLYRIIRDELGLAYSAYSSVSPGPVSGMFYAGADTKPETASAAVAGILGIFGNVQGEKPLEKAEIALASDLFLNSFVFRFDSVDKIVNERAVYELFGYPDDYLENFRENIAKVDPQAALEAARKIISTDSLQIVVVGPERLQSELARFGPVTVIRDVEAFR